MIFGNLLEKFIRKQSQKLSLKLIVSTWFIFVFIIKNSYKEGYFAMHSHVTNARWNMTSTGFSKRFKT